MVSRKYTSGKHWFLATTLLLAAIATFAQSPKSWVPDTYHGVPKYDKQHIFFDDFDNNQNEWNLFSSSLDMKIDHGDFYCKALTGDTYVKRREIPMRGIKDFEIEISIQFKEGPEDLGIGLTFGRDRQGNEYDFYFTADGSYKITKYYNGAYHDYTDWKDSERLKQYAYNTLTLRCVSNQWYFFINQQLVYQMDKQVLFGDDVGFTVGGNMAVLVDYIAVSSLESADITGPVIMLTNPEVPASGQIEVSSSTQSVSGRVYDPAGIKEVRINNFPIDVAEDGSFMAMVDIPNGTTTISIEAKDVYSNLNKKSFSIHYADAASEGQNFLLLIGIDTYEFWASLHNPVRDCDDITDVLVEDYQFAESRTFKLYNEEATREGILEMFEKLQEVVTPKDNLVVYYAGHGFYDKSSKLGYWVPVDARKKKIPDYIPNSTIHDYIKTVNSHHTLLIADACYAGSLFYRSPDVLNENNKSRWAFTSGDLEKVWDGQPGENSPFAKYMISSLRGNTKDTFRADELILEVKTAVQRNTEQTPVGNPLQNVGDEGGVFSFKKR